jgi:predicted NBD/HSP70 family sugar kinase
MRVYNKSHKYYCGIDLHTKMMYVCLMNNKGNILIHKNIPTNSDTFLRLIKKYRKDIVVGAECM